MIPHVEIRYVERDGVRLKVFHRGTGPLVLLLHGFPELAYSWRHQFEPLALAGYTVAAPDQRGFGGSSGPSEIEAYALDELAADAAAIIDSFGEQPAVVIGHDWGAPVAWHTALRFPNKVRAVGSLSVPHARRATAPPLESMRAAAGPDHIFYVDYFQQEGVAESEFEADIRASLLGFMWSISGDAPREERFQPIRRGGRFIDSITTPKALPSWLTEADLQVYVDAFAQSGFRGGLNWYRNVNRNWEQSADLAGATVSQPAMFVTGTRDPARGPAAMERLRDVVTDLRVFEVLEGCGHWTQQERPQAVTRLMLEFLHSVHSDSRTM
jgi:pimeloyl-ACP methyl ester carboxylesterase